MLNPGNVQKDEKIDRRVFMKILVYPHEILKKKAEPVGTIDGALQDFIDEMIELMYKAKGVGLAANQVGRAIRLFVMDVSGSEEPPNPVVIINPVITALEGSEIAEEGCLSVPQYSAKLKRAALVEVKGFDRNGKEIRLEGEGLAARCLQHEIDHLDGICFVDRLSPLKRTMFRKKWPKILQRLEQENEKE